MSCCGMWFSLEGVYRESRRGKAAESFEKQLEFGI